MAFDVFRAQSRAHILAISATVALLPLSLFASDSKTQFYSGNEPVPSPKNICESLVIEATPSMIVQQHGDMLVYNEPHVIRLDKTASEPEAFEPTFVRGPGESKTFQGKPKAEVTEPYDPSRINVLQRDNRFMVSGHIEKVGRHAITWEPLTYVEPAPGLTLKAHVQATLRKFYKNPLLNLPDPIAAGGMKVVWQDPVNPRKLIKAFDFERLRPEQIVFAMQRDLGVEDIIRLQLIEKGLAPAKADVLVVQREKTLLEAGIYMQDYADAISFDRVIQNDTGNTPSPLDFRPERWPYGTWGEIDPVLKALFEIDATVMTAVQNRFHGFVIGHMSPPSKDRPNPFPVFYGIDTTGANLFRHKSGKVLVIDW